MSNAEVASKPVPVVSAWAKPFWEGTERGELVLQHCGDCSKYVFYPRVICPHCSSENLTWEPVSGNGKIYSFTVVYNNSPSAFKADVPYVVAVIELDEGVRMLSNIIECDVEDVKFDMPVTVVFERLNEEFVLPKFRPADNS